MGARDTPAHDSAYESHTAATRSDDGSDRYARIARDDAFHLLKDDRRRAVLRYLASGHKDGPTPVSTLTAFVAAVEHEDGSTSVGEIRERVHIALHHSHLPMLADHGVVDYDHEAGTVEPTPLLAALTPYLADGLDAEDDIVVDTVHVERHGYHNAVSR